MTDNNQAYMKKCNQCRRGAEKLYFTEITRQPGKFTYAMLCEFCREMMGEPVGTDRGQVPPD